MPTSAIKDIRKEIKKGIDKADDKTVRMIYAMLEVDQNKSPWDDAAFIEEIDRRSIEFEKGIAKLYTLDELEKGARSSFKKRHKAAK